MSDFIEDQSLFCVFHNDHRYETEDKTPCSHIFSAVVQARNGRLVMTGQDFDGSNRFIDTDVSTQAFNLAALVPIPSVQASRLAGLVDRVNALAGAGQWPFYFSRDMSVRPARETYGVPAMAPEGHIDPPIDAQNPLEYQRRLEDASALSLVRINCVRMSLFIAQMSGIRIDAIAGLSPNVETGEAVRDRLLMMRDGRDVSLRSSGGGARAQAARLVTPFSDKKKGKDEGGGQMVLGADGVAIVDVADGYFRANKVVKALGRRVDGKSLFNWISEGEASSFLREPLPVPTYLKTSLGTDFLPS